MLNYAWSPAARVLSLLFILSATWPGGAHAGLIVEAESRKGGARAPGSAAVSPELPDAFEEGAGFFVAWGTDDPLGAGPSFHWGEESSPSDPRPAGDGGLAPAPPRPRGGPKPFLFPKPFDAATPRPELTIAEEVASEVVAFKFAILGHLASGLTPSASRAPGPADPQMGIPAHGLFAYGTSPISNSAGSLPAALTFTTSPYESGSLSSGSPGSDEDEEGDRVVRRYDEPFLRVMACFAMFAAVATYRVVRDRDR